MKIKVFLTQLGLDPVQAGDQWLVECPECGDPDHLNVASDTGLAYCHKCSYSANPFKLAKHFTSMSTDGIWKLLSDHGLDAADAPVAAKKPDPDITAKKLRKPSESELGRLAASKQVSIESLRKLNMRVYRDNAEVAVLPMHRMDTKQPCGGIRVRLDGQPVKLSNGKSDKYPMVHNSVVGLLGAEWLKQENANTIILTEGFKDMCAAIEAGFVATTFGGCKSFSDDCLDYFKGKNVIIIFDCDKDGQRAAPRIAERLYLTAKNVSIVPPWCEVTEKHGKDIHDYLKGTEQ